GAGQFAEAKEAFVAATRAADGIGDVESAAWASSGLADLLEAEGNWRSANDLLKKTLATEVETEQRASLLAQQVRVLVRAGSNRQASPVFRQLQEVANNAGLYRELIDAYMFLGDHEWEHGKSRANAMKAYVGALLPATEIGIELV